MTPIQKAAAQKYVDAMRKLQEAEDACAMDVRRQLDQGLCQPLAPQVKRDAVNVAKYNLDMARRAFYDAVDRCPHTRWMLLHMLGAA